MELKKHLDLRYIFVGLYVLLFVAYIVIGLQPARATDYEIAAQLSIPEIGLKTEVAKLTLKNGGLETPDTIAGSFSRAENKTLVIGHSTTVFEDLNELQIGDEFFYNDKTYNIISRSIFAKDDISMTELLSSEDEDTIVLMTCAGELLGNGDATHRLIITAVSK